MAVDFDKLKLEIQSSTGLLAKAKENMPSKKEMAKLALDKLEKAKGKLTESDVRKNFSSLLKELILTEYGLYLEFERDIIGNALKTFLTKEFGKSQKFPELQKLFSNLKANYLQQAITKFEDFMGQTTADLYPVMSMINMSASQAAKSRAGGSLENHLENLFRILGFKFETQKVIRDARIDFLFPSLAVFRSQPENCLLLSSQTTLKDRFRLSLSQISAISNVRKYIVTATGAGIITPRDPQDLTDNKLREIKEKGFEIIVFDEVKKKYSNNPTVMSYSYFVQKEYPTISQLW